MITYRGLSVFMTGLGLGFVLGFQFSEGGADLFTAWWTGKEKPVQISNTVPLPAALNPEDLDPIEQKNKLSPPFDPIQAAVRVSILDARGREISQFYSARIGTDRVLVLPLSLLKQARSVRIRDMHDMHGSEQEVFRALAVDSELALVAIGSSKDVGPYLELSDEDHPLFLSREFSLLTISDRFNGWVDDFQMEMPNSSALVIPIRLRQPFSGHGGILIDPQTFHILGLAVTQMNEEGRLEAVDVNVIRDLLDKIGHTEPHSIAAISQEYLRTTPEGMWEEMQRLIESGDLQGAIALAESLLALDWRYKERVIPLLEQAMGKMVHGHLNQGEYTQALSWLDRGQQIMGDHGSLFLLYGITYYALENFEQSRLAFRRAMELDPALSEQTLPYMRKSVLDEVQQLDQRLAIDRIVELLEEAIQFDPDFAAYHHHLGRYYLRQGRYAAAIASLTRAIGLDYSLSNSLTELINQAQVKLNNPVLTHIPFEQGMGNIYVNVRVNGSAEPFRFVFDTGASHTVISRKLADRLNIRVPSNAPRVWVQTANNRVQASRITLKSIDLGGAVVEDVPALVLDTLGNLEGLLGLSYLKFFKVEIEQEEGFLTLMRK